MGGSGMIAIGVPLTAPLGRDVYGASGSSAARAPAVARRGLAPWRPGAGTPTETLRVRAKWEVGADWARAGASDDQSVTIAAAPRILATFMATTPT
jgi:hypothetical protein